MNKTKLYYSRFSWSILLVFALYLSFVFPGILPIKQIHALIITGSIAIIFALGMLIIAPGLNKDPENFVLRFLVLTTVQMLIALILVAVLMVLKLKGGKIIGFHFLGLFIVLLIIQSFFLIRINKTELN